MWADDEKGAWFEPEGEAPKGVVGRNGTGQPCGHSLRESRTFPTLKLMQFNALIGQTLQSISMPLSDVHPAWVDARTPELAGAYADLTLATGLTVQVQPCEVPIAGRYPALGIELSDLTSASSVASLAKAEPFLPAKIADIRLWDSLGEGPVSAVDLVLNGGVTFTLRHIYPPITLGVDIWPEGRHDL